MIGLGTYLGYLCDDGSSSGSDYRLLFDVLSLPVRFGFWTRLARWLNEKAPMSDGVVRSGDFGDHTLIGKKLAI